LEWRRAPTTTFNLLVDGSIPSRPNYSSFSDLRAASRAQASLSHRFVSGSNEKRQRFAIAAARQSLSESALLRRLVELMLASAPSDDLADPVAPSDPRDARLTIRLVFEDRALLRAA
jgi:hypothetical protein